MGHRIIIPESAEAQLTFWTDPDRRPRPKTLVVGQFEREHCEIEANAVADATGDLNQAEDAAPVGNA